MSHSLCSELLSECIGTGLLEWAIEEIWELHAVSTGMDAMRDGSNVLLAGRVGVALV